MKHARWILLIAALAAVGCAAPPPSPTQTPTPTIVPTETPLPSATPTATATPLPTPTSIPAAYTPPEPGWKAAFLVGSVEGADNLYVLWSKQAGAELGFTVDAVPIPNAASNTAIIEQAVADGYALIMANRGLPDMERAMAKAAIAYPDTRFVLLDHSGYRPIDNCGLDEPQAVSDCYAELFPNLTSVIFANDESAFLAGVAVACAVEPVTIGVIGGPETPAVKRFTKGYIEGAYFVDDAIGALLTFLPSFGDPAAGEAEAKKMIGEGKAEAIFVAAGQSGDGALRAAAEAGVPAVGDYDAYVFLAEARPVLVTGAIKRWDIAASEALKAFARGELHAVFFANLANGGVDIAPYHDWESKISADCKDKVEKVRAAIADGKLKTGYEE